MVPWMSYLKIHLRLINETLQQNAQANFVHRTRGPLISTLLASMRNVGVRNLLALHTSQTTKQYYNKYYICV